MSDEPQFEPRQSAGQRLTRKRVAERLGVSVSTVRRMEGKTLHPIQENGINYFDQREVEQFAPRMSRRPLTEGQLAASAFRLFEAGRDLRQVVSELEIPPRKVRALYSEWRSPDLKAGELNRHNAERAKQDRRDAADHERRMRDLDERLARLFQGMV